MTDYIGMAFIAFIYFLPTVIAWGNKNFMQVLVLNLFLGWSVLGWVVALVMSFKNEN